MLLLEEDSEAFKRWVLPKLETISDADAEVLADYVVALVTTKDTDANIRRNCLESLSDFLQDNTAPFVDEVIHTLKSKSYAPRANTNVPTEAPVPIPSIVGTSTSEYLPNPTHAFNSAPPHAPKGPAASRAPNNRHRLPDRPDGASPDLQAQREQGQGSRKRKQNERDTSQSRHGLHTGNDRPTKQTARRGGRNDRLGGLNAQAPAFAPMPAMPPFDSAFGEVPPFDPGNPMAFLAMAAAFGINLPGMPQMPAFNAQGGEKSNIRCGDYDNKGYCAAGSVCPYQHGLEYEGLGEESNLQFEGAQGDQGYSGRPSGGRSRAPFSLPRPTHDRTNTTIVVEQIPEDNCKEEDVRDFFGKFGPISDVRMQAYKRLAVIKYETHEAATAAYKSPKVIFDNRFVKVYWHRSDADPGVQNGYNNFDADGDEGSYANTEVLDPEEIERRQAEAQRAFEERRKKEEEAAAKSEEIDRKLQETNAEILRVRRELAKASGDANGDMEEEFSQDLATLQAEAENLFAQQDVTTDSWRGSVRGGYRGRGYAPRARGFRGGYRGRGAPFSSARTGVKRLDNRPRRIAVKDVEPGSGKDEALRQHLFNVPDVASTEQHPRQPNTLIITFGERYQAESFIDTAHQISDVGKLEMEWVPNDAFDGVKNEDAEGGGHDSDGDSSATVKEEERDESTEEPSRDAADVDMDVAEDEDQWL